MRKRFLLIVVCMFAAWNTGLLLHGQEPVLTPPVEVAPAPATSPSDVEVDQPATPTTEVPSPAQPSHYEENFMWALLGSLLYQGLKKASWFTLISEDTTRRIKNAYGWGLAVLTAAGINFSIQGNFFDTAGATLTFAGISWSVMKDVLWTWASQQVWYRGFIKEPSAMLMNAMRTAER